MQQAADRFGWKEDVFVIGAGSMAEAFIRGVIERRAVAPGHIHVVNRSGGGRLEELRHNYGVHPAESWQLLRDCRLVVVAVKPADVGAALRQARPQLDGQLLLSFAAGVPMAWMREQVEGRATVIRTMPNIPIAVLAGTTAVAWSPEVNPADQEDVRFLLRQLGDVVELAEQQMDAVTAFSGSGPGFVCYFLEAMEAAAVQLGLAPDVARRLLLQTVIGTAHTLSEWQLSPQELRHRVTSKNGTTHAGVRVMDAGALSEVVAAAVRAAAERSAEMGSEYATRER